MSDPVQQEPQVGGINVQADDAANSDAQRLQDEQDLRKLDEEIRMLKQVLQDKISQSRQLRIKLGQQTPIDNIENVAQNIEKNVNQFTEDISQTEAFKKTQKTLEDVGRSTVGVFNLIGGAVSESVGKIKQSESVNKLSQNAQSFGSSILDGVAELTKPKPKEFNEGNL